MQRLATSNQQLQAWKSAAAASALTGQPIVPVNGLAPGETPGVAEAVTISLEAAHPLVLTAEEVWLSLAGAKP